MKGSEKKESNFMKMFEKSDTNPVLIHYTSTQQRKARQRYMPVKLNLPVDFKNKEDREKLIRLHQNQTIKKTDAKNPIRFEYQVDLIRNKLLEARASSALEPSSYHENLKIDTEESESPRK